MQLQNKDPFFTPHVATKRGYDQKGEAKIERI